MTLDTHPTHLQLPASTPSALPAPSALPPDTLNRVGVLTRREIEARVLAPVVSALGEEFGRERVIEIVRETIIKIAQEQGAALAGQMGDGSLQNFADSLSAWTKDDALRIEVLERSDDAFHFNVTRCRYAELYRALGIPELGAVLSCNRDAALIQGFNPEVRFERTQTIMGGADFCDFRYHRMTPLKYKAVIFDMDGLMVDTESIYSETSRRASAELGYPFDEAFYHANFVGKRLVDSEAFLQRHFGPDYPIDAYRALSDRYLREQFARGVPRKPGLTELLAWLEANNTRKVIATSTVRDLALLTLGDLAGRFESLSTGDEVANGKPAPDIFLLAASRLGHDPADCLVLEDSQAGIRAAHAAGAQPIWVPDLQTPSAEVGALAKRVCPSLHEVLTLLKA
jgi:HAD superfamily hydrolase (TIGR01509 family)